MNMKKTQEKLLEEYLWKLTKVIGEIPGLPWDFMQNRVKELADIFRPIKKRRPTLPTKQVKK